MKTIVEPKEYIDKLWGKQRIRENDIYRMMRYVLRVEHDNKVLLHNVVTGHLVVLDEAEAEVFYKLPLLYKPVLEKLVTEHFLVPENYDEHQQVLNLRGILWRMVEAQTSKDITYYTILPTTACNAHCWYCYEKDITPVTMTEKTARDVVDYITRSCGGKPIKIRWFGGEPTVAAHRIDQISQGLRDRGVAYVSTVTSNGYLFDEEMVCKAKELWNTTQVNISIDGTEETYNRIKAFSGVKDNPYQRMMRNAELLMAQGINVVIRMNYDRDTWGDFPLLLKEVRERFHASHHWMVYPHQINDNAPCVEWQEKESWFNQKNVALFEMAESYGNYRSKQSLPSLLFVMCEAADDSCTTILPDGNLVCCPEQIGMNQIKGNIREGITNKGLVSSWRRFADSERCRDCFMFPHCARLANCSSGERCSGKLLNLEWVKRTIVACYERAI